MANSARLRDGGAQLPGVTVLMCERGAAFPSSLRYSPSAIHANMNVFFLSQWATLNEAYGLMAYKRVAFSVIIPALSANDFAP